MSAPGSDRLDADRTGRRRAVEEFARPLALEAGAGTGKTSVLIARVVAWSLGPGWERARVRLEAEPASDPRDPPDPDRIAADLLSRVAAITFTEAAAAEMAHRTGTALAAVVADAPVIGLPARALPPAPERDVRARALIGALDRFPVRTIHAFCRRILAAHPLEAGLHPSFRVDADAGEQAAAVREAVEAAVRAGYGDPGDPDWVALAADGWGPVELEEALAGLVEADVPAEALAGSPFSEEAVAALRARVAAACARFLAGGGERFEGAPRKARETLAGVREQAALARADGDGAAYLRALAASDVAALARGSRLDAWRNGEWNKSESKALAGVDRAALADAARDLRDLARHLHALDAPTLERAVRVLRPLLAEVHGLLRRRGAVGFEALLRRARDLLRDRPDVAARVRRELDQLLVDEFQDTDPVQCDVIRELALGGPPDERPGLFVVGDPKQSIYGWRNADLRAYRAFSEDLRAAGGEHHLLCENHRSLPAVLDEVERVIAPVMRAEPGLQPPFEPLVPCARRSEQMERRGETPPCAEHWVTWVRGDAGFGPPGAAAAAELEARALARDLLARREAGELAWDDVGILVRSTADLETYLRELRVAGIPYAIERDRSYYQRREVIDAAALVRSVLDPHDQLALVTWLRSPAVGVPDAAWLPLWRRQLPRRAAELTRPDPERLDALRAAIAGVGSEIAGDVPGLDRVAGWEDQLVFALAALAALRADFEREPADVFVERLRQLSLLEATESARFLGPFRAANLDRFFRELREGLDDGADPQALLRRLRLGVAAQREIDEGIRRESADAAVRVMTIHAAKGLDFRHVYLVQLHKRSGERGARPVVQLGEGAGGLELCLFGAPSPGFVDVAAQRERVEAAERVRTLYVAMTRAEERLVLVGCWPRRAEPRPAGRADSHADLLAFRAGGGALDLEERLADAGAEPLDALAARWRVPGAGAAPARRPAGAPARARGRDTRSLARAAETVRARRASARERMERAFAGAVTADDPERQREEAALRRFPGAGEAPPRRPAGGGVAAAAGTAVHRVLEELDLRADPVAERARWRARLPALVASEVEPAATSRAVRRAREILERFAAGPLYPRLRALCDRVVARELPVLIAPAADVGPVGFLGGTLDLVYRDPDADRLVVADYKSDRVAGDEVLAARVRHHAPQAAAYARALRDALGLDYTPRCELWFLDADRIEPVTAAPE